MGIDTAAQDALHASHGRVLREMTTPIHARPRRVTPPTVGPLDVPTLTWRCAALAILTAAALRIPGEINSAYGLARFSTLFLAVAATFSVAWLCQRREATRRAGQLAAMVAGAAVLLAAFAFVVATCWVLVDSGDYAIVLVIAGAQLVVAPGLAAIPLVVLSTKLVRRVRVLLWPQAAATR